MHFLNVLIKFSFTYLVTIALIDILYGSFISSLLRHLISPSQELTKHLSELVFICEKKKKISQTEKSPKFTGQCSSLSKLLEWLFNFINCPETCPKYWGQTGSAWPLLTCVVVRSLQYIWSMNIRRKKWPNSQTTAKAFEHFVSIDLTDF